MNQFQLIHSLRPEKAFGTTDYTDYTDYTDKKTRILCGICEICGFCSYFTTFPFNIAITLPVLNFTFESPVFFSAVIVNLA